MFACQVLSLGPQVCGVYLRVVSLGRGLRLRLFYLSASSSSGAGAGRRAHSVFADQFRSDVFDHDDFDESRDSLVSE